MDPIIRVFVYYVCSARSNKFSGKLQLFTLSSLDGTSMPPLHTHASKHSTSSLPR